MKRCLYQYQPLPTSNHIRLLTIHPGRFDDDVVISLDVFPFEPDLREAFPKYECLSYSWYEEKGLQDVYIMGHELYTLKITENLAAALVHLRYPDKTRVMWVDALCINQHDKSEKGHQVARMGRVFGFAAQVIAWLGLERDGSTRALNTMIWIGNQVDVDYSLWLIKPSKECNHPSFLDIKGETPLREDDTRTIYYLLGRRWFERLWVRQEILLSESRAIVQCGLYQVPWPPFRRALLCLYERRRPQSYFEDKLYARLLFLRGFIGQPSSVDLGCIRLIFGQSGCKDPRDRVFALLEFLKEADRQIVGVPDYTKDVAEIFREIMWRWIMHYTSLNLLSQCEPGVDHPPSTPSWVPDWSEKDIIFGRTYWRHFSSSQFAAICSLSADRRVLTTPGILTMKVTHLQAIPIMKENSVKEVESILCYLLPKREFKEKYPTGVSILEAYTRTFIGNAVAENQEPWTGLEPTLQEAMDIVSRLSNEKNGMTVPRVLDQSTGIFKIARAMLGGRQLMYGSGGYIGIAPRLAQEGDDVCVLLGCHTPMVLRRVEMNKFRIVGECYVLGLSEGEALLGPYPNGIRRVYAKSSKWGVYSCFKNEMTGEMSLEDPRLKSLPLDMAKFRKDLQENPCSKIRPDVGILSEHIPQIEDLQIV